MLTGLTVRPACNCSGNDERKGQLQKITDSLCIAYPHGATAWIPSTDQRSPEFPIGLTACSVSGLLFCVLLLEVRSPLCHQLADVLNMVSVKVSPAGKPLPLARGLPVTVEVKDNATVSDVKAAIAVKFPKVGRTTCFTCRVYQTKFILALRISSKTCAEG
jgi:hypothetical protein